MILFPHASYTMDILGSTVIFDNKKESVKKLILFCNQIYKPSSVLSSHQSRPTVTSRLLRPTTGMTSSHFL